MVNQDLLDYITSQRKEGVDDGTIAAALQESGWEKSDIDEGFAVINDGEQRSGTSASMAEVGDLLIGAFDLFKEKLKPLLIIAISSQAIVLALQFGIAYLFGFDQLDPSAIGDISDSAFFSMGRNIMGVSTLVTVLSTVVQSWAAVAILYVITDKTNSIGAVEAVQQATSKLFPYLAVIFTVMIISAGAFIFLIAPGLIVSVWLVFSVYVMFEENTSVVESIKRSREYVRGYWWPVVGRMFVLGLITSVVGWITGAVNVGVIGLTSFGGIEHQISNVLSSLAASVAYPFSLIFTYLMYKDLKNIKGNLSTEATPTWMFVLFAIVGVFVFGLLYLGFFLLSGDQSRVLLP